MQTTLRAAKKLSQELGKTAQELNYELCVQLNEADKDFRETFADARDESQARLKLRQEVVEAKYELRKLVARKTAEVGVSDLLAEAEAQLELQRLKESANYAQPARDLDEVGSLFEKSKESLEQHEVTVNTGLYTKGELDALVDETTAHRRKAEQLREEAQALNYTTRVTLPDYVVQLCKELGITV